MASREAIAALIYAYAERVDAGDFAGVAQLFAHGTYGAAAGAVLHGATEVLDVFRRLVQLHDDGTPRTKHVTTNLTIALDEVRGTASARSYFTVLQATATLPLQVVAAGRYHDRFEQVGGQWRFAERVVFLDLTGDLSQHLRQT